MTSLFDKIPGMIGSLLRLAHKPGYVPKFHTGGVVSAETLDRLAHGRSHHFMPRGHVIFQGNPLGEGEAFDLRQRRKPSFHVTIGLNPPKTRKRPITDDMAQMCQDLGIEPSRSLTDLFAEMEKAQQHVIKAMAVPRHMLQGRAAPWR